MKIKLPVAKVLAVVTVVESGFVAGIADLCMAGSARIAILGLITAILIAFTSTVTSTVFVVLVAASGAAAVTITGVGTIPIRTVTVAVVGVFLTGRTVTVAVVAEGVRAPNLNHIAPFSVGCAC